MGVDGNADISFPCPSYSFGMLFSAQVGSSPCGDVHTPAPQQAAALASKPEKKAHSKKAGAALQLCKEQAMSFADLTASTLPVVIRPELAREIGDLRNKLRIALKAADSESLRRTQVCAL